jgi:hypothetical protein
MKTKDIVSILIMTAMLTLTATAIVYGLSSHVPR